MEHYNEFFEKENEKYHFDKTTFSFKDTHNVSNKLEMLKQSKEELDTDEDLVLEDAEGNLFSPKDPMVRRTKVSDVERREDGYWAGVDNKKKLPKEESSYIVEEDEKYFVYQIVKSEETENLEGPTVEAAIAACIDKLSSTVAPIYKGTYKHNPFIEQSIMKLQECLMWLEKGQKAK